jgi:hypothetical protein
MKSIVTLVSKQLVSDGKVFQHSIKCTVETAILSTKHLQHHTMKTCEEVEVQLHA